MNKNIQPTISISLKKPLIRIYKETLHLIGTPTHILLLVNPQEHSLIIIPSNKSDVKAHYVAKYFAKKSFWFITPTIESFVSSYTGIRENFLSKKILIKSSTLAFLSIQTISTLGVIIS